MNHRQENPDFQHEEWENKSKKEKKAIKQLNKNKLTKKQINRNRNTIDHRSWFSIPSVQDEKSCDKEHSFKTLW